MPSIYHVTVSTYIGFASDASHYYAELIFHDEKGKYTRVELEHPISTKEAISLNKSDQGPKWKKGDMSQRFDSEKSAIDFAIGEFERLSKPGDVLLRGNSACADPQEVLSGPGAFKARGNYLWKQAKKIDFYENHPKKMEAIYQHWVGLLKEYGVS